MIIARIDGATRTAGQHQGFLGLPIRDELIQERVMGKNIPIMVTAWTPTPDELADLNAGANVHISIAGTIPAPMIVGVGPKP